MSVIESKPKSGCGHNRLTCNRATALDAAPMMGLRAMLVIEIPLPTYSLNRIKRMHPHAYRHLRDQYTILMRSHATSVTRARPKQFRRVTITRYGVRLLDTDNLVGGCKPLVDALERAGLIWDDSTKHVAIDYNQECVPAKQVRTIVQINL